MLSIKRLMTAFVAIAVAVVLVGCSSGEKKVTVKTDTINIEITTAPVGMHPLKTNDSPSQYINNQIYETLYRRTVDGTNYEPLLAADYPSYSDDKLTVTIPLRQNVAFSDGTPFTADSVAYMIDCLKNADYGSQRPSIVASINDYKVVDDHTIELHLAYDDGVLLAKLSHSNGAIINQKLDKTQDFLADPSGAGTGPYKFVSAVAGSTYDLVANDSYWGTAPEIANVHFDVIADEATAVARLQTGEADFYPTVAADSLATVSAITGYTAVNQPSSAEQYLMLRSSADTAANALMANVDFRKALLEAIDIPTYVDSVLSGTATSIKSVVSPSLVGYTAAMDDSYIAYDADAAKKAVDDNGWSGQAVTILCSTREAHQTLAAYIQDSLTKIGLTVNIVSEEWATYLADSKNDKAFDISVMGWSNVTGDGQQMLEPNFSTKNGVRLKYNNAEFDSYVDAAAKTTDLAERQAAMLKAVQKIQGDAVAAPLYATNSLFAYNSQKFENVTIGMGGEFSIGTFTLAAK